MASHYHQLYVEERACIIQITAQEPNIRQIASLLRRVPSSIRREIRRHTTATVAYDAAVAGRQAIQR